MVLTDLLGENWEATKEIAKARISNFFKGNIPKYSAIVLPLAVSQIFNVTPIYAQDSDYDNIQKYEKLIEEYDDLLSNFNYEGLTSGFDSEIKLNQLKKTIEDTIDFVLEKDVDKDKRWDLIDQLGRVVYSKPEQKEIVNLAIDALEEIGSKKGVDPLTFNRIAYTLNHSLYNYISIPNQKIYSRLEDAFINILPNLKELISEWSNWKSKERRTPEAIEAINYLLDHSNYYQYDEAEKENEPNENNLQILEETLDSLYFDIFSGFFNPNSCSIKDKCGLLNLFIDDISSPGADKTLTRLSPFVPSTIMIYSAYEKLSDNERDALFSYLIKNLKENNNNYEGPLKVLKDIASEDYSRWEDTEIEYGFNATNTLCDILKGHITTSTIIKNKIISNKYLKEFPFDSALELIKEISYSEENIKIILENMDSILRHNHGENTKRYESIEDYVKNVALGEQYEGEESQEIKTFARKIYEERTGLIIEEDSN